MKPFHSSLPLTPLLRRSFSQRSLTPLLFLFQPLFLIDLSARAEGEKVLQVYTRKKKMATTDAPLAPHQDASSDPSPNPGNSSLPDSDLPIVIRKGVRSCVKYHLANFVSYQSLSPSHRSFALALSFVSVPHSVAEALSQPQWMAAM